MSDIDALARLDAVAQAELVRTGALSAVDLVDACAARAAKVSPWLHAFTVTDFEAARLRAAGPLAGPLAGVPLAVKDLVPVPGLRMSLGSRLFARNVAAPPAPPFVERLTQAGGVIVGKTTTSELGLLGSTETLLEGITHNPWDPSRSAAGSSGGSAAAVAAGIVPIAHASDGGGSIRIPASVCGLFGLKPSRGRVVPTQLVASPLDPLLSELCVSRSVRDTALFLSLVEATDGAYARVGNVTGPSSRRLRIATWSTTLMGAEPEAEVRAALEQAAALCRALGHDVEVVTPPVLDGRAIGDAFFTAAGTGIAGLFAMMEQALGRPVGPGDAEPFTRALVAWVQGRPAGALEAAMATIASSTAAYLERLSGFDAVLTPTVAVLPWRLGELSPVHDFDTLMRRTERAVGYTPIHNMVGAPAMSVPLAWSADGLPIGMCFAAKPGDEATLLSLAYELEAARPWKDRWPPYSYPALYGGA